MKLILALVATTMITGCAGFAEGMKKVADNMERDRQAQQAAWNAMPASQKCGVHYQNRVRWISGYVTKNQEVFVEMEKAKMDYTICMNNR